MALAEVPNGVVPTDYFAYGLQTNHGWIITGRDAEWVAENTEVLLQGTAWGLGVALILSIALAVFIARRNETRIERFEDALMAVGAGRTTCGLRMTATTTSGDWQARSTARSSNWKPELTAIRQVSTDVAHDLRAPLARLRMRLEPHVLRDQTPDDLRDELGRALEDLDALSATFDAILRLSRMQAGLVPLQAEAFDLATLCRELAEMLAPSAEDAGHTFTADIPPTAIVHGDRDLIAQAVLNLVDNAMRHSKTLAEIQLKVAATSDSWLVSVSDSGPGIPEADRKRATERFVRLDTSRNTPGAGLGLSLVTEILRLHGSELHMCDNSPGLRVEFELN